MAKLGFNYAIEEENTENQRSGGGGLLPHMYARLEAETMEPKETDDGLGHYLNICFAVIEPEEFKGRKFWADWTVQHANAYDYPRYKYGKPMFDRFVRAAAIDLDLFERDPDTDHLILKPFVAEVGIQIGGPNKNTPGEFYKDKNQIDRFFYDDDGAKEPIPDLGVIGDGTQGKKRNESAAPANDNRRPAANENKPAAAAGGAAKKNPWSK